MYLWYLFCPDDFSVDMYPLQAFTDLHVARIFWQGVLHTTGGYMVYAATTFKFTFDYQDDDIYWFVLRLFIYYSVYLHDIKGLGRGCMHCTIG